ncbi:MAG: hypothetical protein H5T59_10405 [Anaerolineae bacterium]|nr:hypothetical protein [Anaerolineae bacterium]
MCALPALAGALALAEAALRSRHRRSARREPDPGLRPAARDFAEDVEAWALRVVALGDSNTYGYGLPAEAAYPALLEARLRAHGLRARVWNAGINGQTVLQGLARLERDVIQRRPDVVLVAFGLNDCNLQRWPTDDERERATFPSGWQWCLRQCHLARTAWVRLGKWLHPAHRSDEVWQAPQPLPRVHPLRFRQGLVRLAREVRRRTGARVYFLTPNPVQIAVRGQAGKRQQRTYHLFNACIRVAAWEAGAGLVDLERMLGALPPSAFLMDDGVHLTREGHQHVAEAIWAAWQQEGWLGLS